MIAINKGHNFIHEVQTMVQLFFPNDKLKILNYNEEIDILEENLLFITIDNFICTCELDFKGEKKSLSTTYVDGEERKAVKKCLYFLLKDFTNLNFKWGSFTGIRPQKLVHDHRNKGFNDSQIYDVLENNFDMKADKINLCFLVANKEKLFIDSISEKSFSLYVGVPFCPTKCSYCSFISYPLSFYKNKTEGYFSALKKEMESFSFYGEENELNSVYVGGGTPTSVSDNDFYEMLKLIKDNYIKDKKIEFTVEAGRADTITEKKLEIMKSFGVTRISINPQTMNEVTLKKIGRNVSNETFLNAFWLARKYGFDNINLDIILGLNGETVEDVKDTTEIIKTLHPESLTVHTLALKRASEDKLLNKEFKACDYIDEMLLVSQEAATEMNLSPYYMYRQKNMVGQSENIGYCKDSKECIFNIHMMGDCQNILAFGSGATSKRFFKNENKIERAFNVKDVNEYINRIDEMIVRKQQMFGRF